MSDWSAKNPYFTQITENFILNGEGSRKETRHIVFALGDSGLDYKVGDALGVIAENPPHIVEELLDVQGWDRDATVTTHNGERSLYDALKKDFEVHMANKKFVQSLAEKVVSSGMKISMSIVARTRNDASWAATDDQQIPPSLRPSVPSDDPAAQVEAITADTKAIEDYLWTRDYVDIMREFEVKYSPEEFLELADRLKPRLYSIASSHDAHPGFVELTVGIVRFEYNGRARGGLCTQFMADEINTSGAPIGVFMSPTKSFILPEDKDTDIIMVGPGTGIAPFRAFMEQRVFDGVQARTGCFSATSPKRRSSTTKTKLKAGSTKAISGDSPRRGLATKRRRSTCNTGSRSTVLKFGSGSSAALTSTFVATSSTWPRTSTEPSSKSPSSTAGCPRTTPPISSRKR